MRTLLFVSLCLVGCAGVQLPKEKLGDDPGAMLFNGYAKPKVECYACHNGDAKGTIRGPGLADEVAEHSDEQLKEVIKEGDGRMPAHKDLMSDEEVGQILAWLRVTFPTAAPAAAPAAAPVPAP